MIFQDPHKEVIIMGGGPAGLTAAYQLCKLGVASVVLEKDDAVGGISKTVSYKGYSFDIGGHRFFTKVEAVDAIWREILAEQDFLHRQRLSRIYFHGKFFDYPLKAGNALAGLGILNSALILLSYFKARLFPKHPEVSFEDWVSNRFGKRLYHTFFKAYTEKVWGIPCSEITAEWAAQRIKGLCLKSAVWHSIQFKRSADKSKVIKTLIASFDYPKKGPGMMWDAARDAIQNNGSEIRLNAPVERIEWAPDGVTAVYTSGSTTPITGTHFLSTLPVRNLIEQLDPPPPAEIIEAARTLKYRDFLTVALVINTPELFKDNWIYIHDPEVSVGRIQNFKNWSPEMVPDSSKTCLGLEYFCFEGDGLWSMTDDELIALGKKELASLGLAKVEQIQDGVVVRMPKAYPVYDSTYKAALAKIRSFLAPLTNLQLIGRNGMHKYNNQDHSMLTAMLAVKNIQGGKHDLWNVNVEQEYHEELKALDASQPRVPERTQQSCAV